MATGEPTHVWVPEFDPTPIEVYDVTVSREYGSGRAVAQFQDKYGTRLEACPSELREITHHHQTGEVNS